jgi:hypothetical protein
MADFPAQVVLVFARGLQRRLEDERVFRASSPVTTGKQSLLRPSPV